MDMLVNIVLILYITKNTYSLDFQWYVLQSLDTIFHTTAFVVVIREKELYIMWR